jgi:hypothetical protein
MAMVRLSFFGDARVELGGKEFRHVDWPLIRGLFVEQE